MRFRPFAVLATMLLLAGTLTHASAAAAADVVTYQRNADYLPGARTQTDHGTRSADGGCRFQTSGRRHTSTGPAVLVFTELSYSPKTCTRTLAAAEYQPGQVPPRIAQKLAVGDKAGNQRKTEKGAQAAVPYTGAGYLQVWYEDPVYIDLALTRSTLNWNWSYPDLLLAGTTYHQAYWYWFAPSGWRLDRSDQQLYNDGDLALTDTIGHFSNPIFCLGDTTYADHNQTLFYAADGGYWGWSYDVQKSGGCSGPIQMPGFYSWAINVT